MARMAPSMSLLPGDPSAFPEMFPPMQVAPPKELAPKKKPKPINSGIPKKMSSESAIGRSIAGKQGWLGPRQSKQIPGSKKVKPARKI